MEEWKLGTPRRLQNFNTAGRYKERRLFCLSRTEEVLQYTVLLMLNRDAALQVVGGAASLGYVVSVGRKAQGLHNL